MQMIEVIVWSIHANDCLYMQMIEVSAAETGV